MKKSFILMLAVAACQLGAVQAAVPQSGFSLENSFESARTSLAEINAGKAALPEIRPQIIETPPQTVWPLPSATQWYWYEANENLSLTQVEAAAAEFKSGFIYVPVLKGGAVLLAMHVEKKKNKPQKIYFDNQSLTPQPMVLAIPVSDSPYEITKKVRVAYASSQGPDNKWLVWVFFGMDGEFQFYFKTEGEARKFADIIASCRKLAAVSPVVQPKLGFTVSDITPAQADALGKNRIDSALVTNVAYDGPGDKAGVLFMDIITEVNGVKVRNAGHYDTLIEAAAPGSTIKLGCLERTEVVDGNVKTYIWKPKTVEILN